MESRNRSLDTWKGIAIIAVVGIHATGEAFAFPPDNPNHWTVLLFRAIFNFSVALFFAISGYLAPNVEEIHARGLPNYYNRRLSRLWIAYLLWTAVYLLIYDKAAFLDPVKVAKAVLLGRGIGIGYFVIVLSFLIVLHPLIARLPKARALVLSAIISAFSVAVLYWVRIEYQGQRFAMFPFTGLPFTTWMVFYYLGFYLRAQPKPPIRGNRMLLSMIAVSFALSFAESMAISRFMGNPELAVSQIKFTTYLYSICVSLFALRGASGYWNSNRFLSWAGKRSYAIYLSHLLFLALVTSLMDWVAVLHDYQIVYVPIAVTLTVVAASGCIALIEYVLPARVAGYIIGVNEGSKATRQNYSKGNQC